MNRTEFSSTLKQRLAKLPDYEISKTIAFYNESIDDRMEDGMSEDEAIASLGEIDKIVSEIFIDTPLTALIQDKIKQSRSKSTNKPRWTVLAICSFPIWLPVTLALVCALFVVYLSVWIVVVCLFVSLFFCCVAGVGGIIKGIYASIFLNPMGGVALVGLGIAAIGLFIMTIKPVFLLSKQFIALTAVFLRKVKKLFIAKEEAIK